MRTLDLLSAASTDKNEAILSCRSILVDIGTSAGALYQYSYTTEKKKKKKERIHFNWRCIVCTVVTTPGMGCFKRIVIVVLSSQTG